MCKISSYPKLDKPLVLKNGSLQYKLDKKDTEIPFLLWDAQIRNLVHNHLLATSME